MNAPLVIPTEKDPVILRQLTIEDAPAYFEAVDANRNHLSQFGDETAAKYPNLESVEESFLNPSNPAKLRLGIWDSNTFVGSANLTPGEDGKSAEIGYWLDDRHTGKGYATVATRALAAHARQQRFHRVFANVTVGNEASASVLKRAGFVQTAQRAGSLAFELAKRLPDALYQSSYALETITSREHFLATEHIRAFREQYAPQYTPQRADRAFGILLHPSSGGTALSKRHDIKPEELGLIVKTREEVGLPLPSRDAQVGNVNVVQVGSFLDFADEAMSRQRLWGLNKETLQLVAQLAEHLKSQLEPQAEANAQG